MASPDPEARSLQGPGFPGDTGEQAPEVGTALSAHASIGSADTFVRALSALAGSRVLVPVVALAGEMEPGEPSETGEPGPAREKTSDMATVLLTGADGRQALLAFTSVSALHIWRPGARPVPVTMRDAARAALHDGASALVVDLAGPARLVVEERDLRALAAGWELARVGDSTAWVAPAE